MITQRSASCHLFGFGFSGSPHRHSGKVRTLNVPMTAAPNIIPMCPTSPPAPPNGTPAIRSRVNSKKTSAEITSETMHNIFGIIVVRILFFSLNFLRGHLQIGSVSQLRQDLQQRIQLEKLCSISVNEFTQTKFTVE